MSKFAVFSGHCVLTNGNYTGAKGDLKNGEINETLANEDVAKAVHKWLEIGGASSDLFIIPRKTLSSKSKESSYKLPKANAQKYDCVVEIHFNAFQDKDNPMGTECLYYSNASKVYAQRVNDSLDDIFKDRQVKYRDNLYMLTKTNSPSIIVEVCFCDSKADCDIYNKYGADYVGKLIAEGLLNKKIEEPKPTPTVKPSNIGKNSYTNGSYNRKAKVVVGANDVLNVRNSRNAQATKIGSLKDGQIIEVKYCLNNWFSTWALGKEGYVSGAYLELL